LAEIFVSYKSDRRNAARHVKRVLDCYFGNGREDCVWYDYGLIPGDEFAPRIMAELAQAKVVLVLWCTMAVKSEWVAKEASAAQRAGKFLPVWIEPCALPQQFAGADTINLSQWDASPRSHMLDRLLDEIGRRLGRDAISPIGRLRELEEEWRAYGAPALAKFALSAPLEPGQPIPSAELKFSDILGMPPADVSPNLAQQWQNARRGEPDALFYVASCYEGGAEGLPQNDPEAARLYKVAADLGNADAQNNLGHMYQRGYKVGRGGGLHGVVLDYKAAFHFYKLAADRGHAPALFNLAAVYEDGVGVAKDEREAARLFKLAADQGHSASQQALGRLLERGRGVIQDEREALRLYRLAADQGSLEALNSLGSMFQAGRAVEKNEREAARLYRLAADKGSRSAQFNLGLLYHTGVGVPLDEQEAARFYRLAADQGVADAQVNLAAMHMNGRGVPKDEQEAVRLYQLAAGPFGRHALAQARLGHIYLHGTGVAKDERAAADLFKLAADQGSAEGQSELGLMYAMGLGGLPNDFQEALRLFRLAADQGNANGLRNLGVMYRDGLGGLRMDEREAVRLWKLAAAKGDVETQQELTRLGESW
jgi:TPR repeat protein